MFACSGLLSLHAFAYPGFRVDVGVVLGCRRECARLAHLFSRQRNNKFSLSVSADFLVLAMRTLHILEVSMVGGYLDLPTCGHDCSPLGCIIVGLQKAPKLCEMLRAGLCASPKGIHALIEGPPPWTRLHQQFLASAPLHILSS